MLVFLTSLFTESWIHEKILVATYSYLEYQYIFALLIMLLEDSQMEKKSPRSLHVFDQQITVCIQ